MSLKVCIDQVGRHSVTVEKDRYSDNKVSYLWFIVEYLGQYKFFHQYNSNILFYFNYDM